MATSGQGPMAVIAAVLSTGVVLARVGIVVGVAMLLFLFAFLGYFVVPFVFVLLALGEILHLPLRRLDDGAPGVEGFGFGGTQCSVRGRDVIVHGESIRVFRTRLQGPGSPGTLLSTPA